MQSNVVYNSEFLREASAKEDFANQHTQIFGHYDNTYDDAPWWADLFNEIIPILLQQSLPIGDSKYDKI